MVYTIDELKRRITPVAEKYELKSVYLFGSYARGTATDESDVDILVDREGSIVHGILIGGLYEDMQSAVDKEVDLITTQSLQEKSIYDFCPEFADNISKEKMQIYGRSKHTDFTT